ncbi:MAG: gamma-glutamylcyclotransferase [Mycobacteriales bacterium]
MTFMFLNGGAMKGGPVHEHLADSPFIRETITKPNYRFYEVSADFPGLWPVKEDGASIAGELYDVPLFILHDLLLPNEPDELELGLVELEDGATALGMVLRAAVHERGDLRDITEYGGWRAWLAARDAIPKQAP